MKAHCAVKDLNRRAHFHVLQYMQRLCHMGLQMLEVPVFYLLVSKEQQTPPHQKYYNEKWGKTAISQLFWVLRHAEQTGFWRIRTLADPQLKLSFHAQSLIWSQECFCHLGFTQKRAQDH